MPPSVGDLAFQPIPYVFRFLVHPQIEVLPLVQKRVYAYSIITKRNWNFLKKKKKKKKKEKRKERVIEYRAH